LENKRDIEITNIEYYRNDLSETYHYKLFFKVYTNVYRTNYIENEKTILCDYVTPTEKDFGDFWKPFTEYTNKLKGKIK